MPFLRYISKGVTLTAAVFITAAPLCALLIGTLIAAVNGDLQPAGVNLTLLLESIALNFAAALLCMLLGALAALSLWLTFGHGIAGAAAIIPLLLLVPPFIHVQAWIFAMDSLAGMINAGLGTNLNFTGSFAVILTAAFAYLPVTASLGLAALLGVSRDIADQTRLETDAQAAFRSVYLPYLLAFSGMGGALVFLLCLSDYGISSLFSVSTYAMELFARFSAGFDKYSVFVCALPLIAVSVCILGPLVRHASNGMSGFVSFEGENPFKRERILLLPKIAGLVICLLFLLVPVYNLFGELLRSRNAAGILASSMPQFTYSVMVSAAAAILSAVIALPFAYYTDSARHKALMLCLAAIPFVLPSAVAGLAMISLWNTPLLSAVYRSPLMPAIALAAKYLFIDIMLFWFAFSRLDKDLTDNMKVHYPGALRAAWHGFRLIDRHFAAGLLITFSLCMGEFGVTLLVTPPGYQTITVKIYNYLHYGASETIAVLCVFMLAAGLTGAAAVWLLLRRARSVCV